MSSFGSVDFSDLEEFADKLNELSKVKVEQFIKDVTIQLGWKLMGKAMKNTPVDTGTLKASWQLTDVKEDGDNYYITLINPMEYASFVEYGHRQEVGRYVPKIRARLKRPWVDGYFFLTKADIEMGQELPKLIETKVREFLKKELDI